MVLHVKSFFTLQRPGRYERHIQRVSRLESGAIGRDANVAPGRSWPETTIGTRGRYERNREHVLFICGAKPRGCLAEAYTTTDAAMTLVFDVLAKYRFPSRLPTTKHRVCCNQQRCFGNSLVNALSCLQSSSQCQLSFAAFDSSEVCLFVSSECSCSYIHLFG